MNEEQKIKMLKGSFFDRNKGWFAIGMILGLAVLGLILTGKGNKKEDKPDAFSAYVISQQFVEQKLKAPATAEFPAYSKINVNGSSETKQYVVRAYVDSQNSFSAMIRTHYICTVKYLGNEKWELLSLVFEE